VRLAALAAGLFLFALGIVLLLQSRLGLSPWDVLTQGLERRTFLTFGTANVLIGLVVLATAWALGARIGLGTFANAILIGLYVDALLLADAVSGLAEGWPVLPRLALVLAGIAAMGIGTAVYVGAAYGAGPRDSLMLVGAARTGRRVGAVRAAIEVSVLLAGWALGGTVGVGTVAFALLIGPSVELGFGLLRRTPLARADGLPAEQVSVLRGAVGS
jgi:uncharacterized membrane protein YczE